MAVTDIIIILGILGACGLIFYMLREIFKWDKIVVTGQHFLLLVVGFVILIIILGNIIITTLLNALLSAELLPMWIFIGAIVVFIGVFYVGKMFKQW